MADEPDNVSPEDASLIDQLLEDGFRYESNGRVDGLATTDQVEEDDEDQQDLGDDPESPDGGSDGSVESSDDVDNEPLRPVDAPAPVAPHSVLAGTQISEAEAQGLLNLRQLLIDNPELATKVDKVLRGESEPVVAQEPPELPEVIDPDDPTSKFLWDQLQKLTGEITSVREQTKAEQERASQARVNAEIAQAVERFRSAHPSLSEEDIQNVRNHTSANVNVPGVMANFPDDPVEGLTRALEIGSLTDPQTRDKVLELSQQAKDRDAEDKERKTNLNALSGSSGGSRRRPAPRPKPGTWNEVAAELAKAIQDGSV